MSSNDEKEEMIIKCEEPHKDLPGDESYQESS